MRWIAALVLLMALALGLRTLRAPPPPPPPPATPAHQPGRTGPYWPLDPGTGWRYRVTGGTSTFRSRDYRVEGPSGPGVRVLEFTDGSQSDDFIARAGEGDGVLYREFAASPTEVQWLPAELVPGAAWDLKKNLRARCLGAEEVTVPAFPDPIPAMKIEYESHYGSERTEDPGWYTEGLRWFARGVGLVKEDLTGQRGPPEMKPLVEASRRVLELTEFHPPSR